MSLLNEIKNSAQKNGTKIQSTLESSLEKRFNNLFYAEKNREEEVKFVNQMFTRGGDGKERVGLHASAIIAGKSDFCERQQVLSLVYRQLQGEQINVGLKRIFEEGNVIHEKWQRLFIRGKLGKSEDMDFTRFIKKFELSFTPDAILTIDGEKYVIEIKSVNTYSFKKMNSHPSGKKQCLFYMRLLKINKGIVLCDDKNTQDFKIFYYEMNEENKLMTDEFIERLKDIQAKKTNLIENGKLVAKHEKCDSYISKKATSCPMRDVCFNKKKELIK
jgi:hypothetical protein